MDILVKQGKYQEALALALSFYNNKAKGVVGLGGGSHKRRSVVANRVSIVQNVNSPIETNGGQLFATLLSQSLNVNEPYIFN